MNRLRLLLFLLVAAFHGLALFFVAFNIRQESAEPEERVRVMKLTDIAEYIPPPPENPPPPPPPQAVPPPDNAVETIAEEMVETEEEPEDQILVEAGSIVVVPPQADPAEEEYLPAHKISVLPEFPNAAIQDAIRYPVIAERSKVEGRVILDLFVDRTGNVRRIDVLREDPPNRGFGKAAVEAFQEVFRNPKNRCKPALANGEPVSAHIRYPVSFRIR
jgi:protein TonB